MKILMAFYEHLTKGFCVGGCVVIVDSGTSLLVSSSVNPGNLQSFGIFVYKLVVSSRCLHQRNLNYRVVAHLMQTCMLISDK